MKVRSLRELSRSELVQKRDDLKEEMFNLKMRRSIKTLDNPLRLRCVGREIAQVNTLLREDELKIRQLADSKSSILSDAKPRKNAEK